MSFPPDFGPDEIRIIRAVQPYTLTSPERIFALIKAVRYIVRYQIPGDLVECGIYEGGSVMAMALTLVRLDSWDRTLYLFDTFTGMPPPGEQDIDFEGAVASDNPAWTGHFKADIEEVKLNVLGTGYGSFRFVVGRVEETIPACAPAQIALLRLDTDWYESTRHELAHLYPRLSYGGVLIIDDYGHWRGAQQATDEYFADVPILLNRIDQTGRIGIKTLINP